MIRFLLIFTVILMVTTSCSILNFSKTIQEPTNKRVILGTIGNQKNSGLQKTFNVEGIPSFTDPIKVSVMLNTFNKKTFKLYTKAKSVQGSNLPISYKDTLAGRASYVKLEIEDKVSVIQALNSESNLALKSFLEYQTNAKIVSGIAIAFSKEEMVELSKAEAVFLVAKGLKNYELQIYEGNKKSKTITFSQGVIFAYESSSFCWDYERRDGLRIVDMVMNNERCPRKTQRSAVKAQDKIKPLKF